MKDPNLLLNIPLPGVGVKFDYTDPKHQNPILTSPNSEFDVQFQETRDTLSDPEIYNSFLSSAVMTFRHSITYTHYKGFLYSIGLDRCQFLGNITAEMLSGGKSKKGLEMHHNILTARDLAFIITESCLVRTGMVTTFDVAYLLKKAHKEHKVQLVMLSVTPHQLYHNDPDFFIHPDMCIGKWWEFLAEYKDGIRPGIARKIIWYIEQAIEKGGSDDVDLLTLRDEIEDWSKKNVDLGYLD